MSLWSFAGAVIYFMITATGAYCLRRATVPRGPRRTTRPGV